MAPFEVLYGRRCRTPLNWIEPGEEVIFGPDHVEDAESTIHHIKDNLKAAKSRQETYANKRRRPLEFEVGNQPLLLPATPPRRSPGPYKRAMRPPTLTAPHPLSPELLRDLVRPGNELKPPPFAASGAPPRYHSSVTGEHLLSTASTDSSSPSITGKHRELQRP
jgi:hypothetical protein